MEFGTNPNSLTNVKSIVEYIIKFLKVSGKIKNPKKIISMSKKIYNLT